VLTFIPRWSLETFLIRIVKVNIRSWLNQVVAALGILMLRLAIAVVSVGLFVLTGL